MPGPWEDLLPPDEATRATADQLYERLVTAYDKQRKTTRQFERPGEHPRRDRALILFRNILSGHSANVVASKDPEAWGVIYDVLPGAEYIERFLYPQVVASWKKEIGYIPGPQEQTAIRNALFANFVYEGSTDTNAMYQHQVTGALRVQRGTGPADVPDQITEIDLAKVLGQSVALYNFTRGRSFEQIMEEEGATAQQYALALHTGKVTTPEQLAEVDAKAFFGMFGSEMTADELVAFKNTGLLDSDILPPRVSAFLLRTGRMTLLAFDREVGATMQSAAESWIADNVTDDTTRKKMLAQSKDYAGQLSALLRTRPYLFTGGLASAVSSFMPPQFAERVSSAEGIEDAIESAIAARVREDPAWAGSARVKKRLPTDLAAIFQKVNAQLTKLTPVPDDNGLPGGVTFVSALGAADITPEMVATLVNQAVQDQYQGVLTFDKAADEVLAKNLLAVAKDAANFDLLQRYARTNNVDLGKLLLDAKDTGSVKEGDEDTLVNIALTALKAQIPKDQQQEIDTETAARAARGDVQKAAAEAQKLGEEAAAFAGRQEAAGRAKAVDKAKALAAIQGLTGAALLTRLARDLGTDPAALLEVQLQAVSDGTMTWEQAIEQAIRGAAGRLPFKEQGQFILDALTAEQGRAAAETTKLTQEAYKDEEEFPILQAIADKMGVPVDTLIAAAQKAFPQVKGNALILKAAIDTAQATLMPDDFAKLVTEPRAQNTQRKALLGGIQFEDDYDILEDAALATGQKVDDIVKGVQAANPGVAMTAADVAKQGLAAVRAKLTPAQQLQLFGRLAEVRGGLLKGQKEGQEALRQFSQGGGAGMGFQQATLQAGLPAQFDATLKGLREAQLGAQAGGLAPEFGNRPLSALTEKELASMAESRSRDILTQQFVQGQVQFFDTTSPEAEAKRRAAADFNAAKAARERQAQTVPIGRRRSSL